MHKPHAGEGEKFMREAFTEAYSQASQGRPAVIFIDELDDICPPRGSRQVCYITYKFYICQEVIINVFFTGESKGPALLVSC